MTTYLLISFLSSYLLWIFYLAVMNLKQAKDKNKLSTLAYILGYPLLVLGYLIDALVNIFVASGLFLEFPKELTVTSRLTRHIETNPTSWRGNLALFITEHLLDVFDPSGKHR